MKSAFTKIYKDQFMIKLQEEASLQARLNKSSLIPPQFDGITSFLGRYPWQCLLVLSGLTSLALEIYKAV